MLGITYTRINCDKKSCKYNDNKNGVCDPPSGDVCEVDEIKVINGICKTYKRRNKRKKA